LRSKTTKLRLKNCPAHVVRGASAICYVTIHLHKCNISRNTFKK